MNESDGSGPEQDDAEAQSLLKARLACELAEMSLAGLSGDDERERFEKYVSKAEALALSITDPFYRSGALHPIVTLLAKPGELEWSSRLLEQIQDAFVRTSVERELREFRNA